MVENNFLSILKSLNEQKKQLLLLEKTIKKIQKQINKGLKKKKIRTPSGFAVPARISDNLCDFMKCPRGSKMARTEVTCYIIKYIKNNNLQSDTNRRIIFPNNSLKKLLGNIKEDLTFFNLQRHMNQHFYFN